MRVSLGLKPTFDKLVGGRSPHNVPGRPVSLAADASGVYVVTKAEKLMTYIRKFDLDGRYLQALIPSPSSLPEEKLAGQGFVEYEPGKRALHARALDITTSGYGFFTLGELGKYLNYCQSVIVDRKLFLCSTGPAPPPGTPLHLHGRFHGRARGKRPAHRRQGQHQPATAVRRVPGRQVALHDGMELRRCRLRSRCHAMPGPGEGKTRRVHRESETPGK